MPFDYRAGIVQLNSTTDYEKNLALAEQLLEQLVTAGARLIAFPELFTRLGPFEDIVAGGEADDGPTAKTIQGWATKWGVYICGGTICEVDGACRYNTCLFFGPDGTRLAKYRKMHLFHAEVPGQVSISESDHFSRGHDVVVVPTELGNIALATCYDLRFPELFRRFADRQADVVILPSAFTANTGKAHWHPLVRSRAIENQLYVIAPNQAGRHTDKLASFGHSLIVDPWGDILAEGHGSQHDCLIGDIQQSRIRDVRQFIPALRNRQLPTH